MRILLDAGLSTLVELTGIGQQCLGLYGSMSKYADTTLHTYEVLRGLPRILRRGMYTVVSNFLGGFLRYDVIHFVNYQTTRFPTKAVKVVTIHDLTAFLYPDCLPPWYVGYAKRAITSSVKRADLIIVPSEAVKEEISTCFSSQPEKVVRCPNGLRESFRRVPHGKPGSGLSDTFFLFVGTLEKRKNVDLLVRIFSEAKSGGDLQKETRLFLVGRRGYGFDEIKRILPGDDSVRVLGHVTDDQLADLYQKTKALILPSIYEGFGVPLLEAMWFGVPIIRSDFASGGELDRRHNSQMFHFAEGDDQSLKELLIHVDKNSQRLRRELHYGDLSMYDYDVIAQQHLAAYERAISGR